MPRYDFRCEACNANVEIVRPMREALEPVFCDCGLPRVQQLGAAYVTPDIAPYRAVAGDRAGQFITSRRDHREFLKRNRLVEIGNDTPKDTSKARPLNLDKRELREQMKPIVRETIRKHSR